MKTVILCGGRGTRLCEETGVRPKPMVNIDGRPMVGHIMDLYSHWDFHEFILALGYKGEVIKEYFLNYSPLSSDFTLNMSTGKIETLKRFSSPWKVHLVDTGLSTLTGGRLKRLLPQLKNEKNFFLTYGDGLSNVNLKALLDFHLSHNKIATVTAVRPPSRFGELTIDQFQQVKRFNEKPQTHEGWINGGFFVFRQEIFELLDSDQCVLEKGPLETLASENQLAAFRHEGFWQCMDTMRDKLYLESLAQGGDRPWPGPNLR